jgi:hypothetical protein
LYQSLTRPNNRKLWLTLNKSALSHDTRHLKMFVIFHCCWRQTDALFIAVLYDI